MKLTSIYDPAHHRLAVSRLYAQSHNFFQQLFSPPSVTDPTAIGFTSNGFEYNMPSCEVRFYSDDYMVLSEQSSEPEADRFRKYYSPEEYATLKIGANEQLVLTFLENEVKKNHYLLGPVGAGKSTLLRYVFFYLLPRSAALCKLYIPIYVRLDTSTLPDRPTAEQFALGFRTSILNDPISRMIESPPITLQV